jgi:hypothetical protein
MPRQKRMQRMLMRRPWPGYAHELADDSCRPDLELDRFR